MGWADDLTSPDGTLWVIGCGSRHWTDEATVAVVLERVRRRYPILTVVEGGQRGADMAVAHWAAPAQNRGVHWIHEAARWDDYGWNERWRAAHERNALLVYLLTEALAAGHGAAVLVFKDRLDDRLFTDSPGNARGGTEDVVRRAWAHNIGVWHCRGYGEPPARVRPQSLF